MAIDGIFGPGGPLPPASSPSREAQAPKGVESSAPLAAQGDAATLIASSGKKTRGASSKRGRIVDPPHESNVPEKKPEKEQGLEETNKPPGLDTTA